MNSSRVLLDQMPSAVSEGRAQWISVPNFEAPSVAAYKCEFFLDEPATIRVHVSGDERYELFASNLFVEVKEEQEEEDWYARKQGPERGDAAHWSFETYDLKFDAGANFLAARVFSLEKQAPHAQLGVCHGFWLCPDNQQWTELLATGQAKWEGRLLGGFEWLSPLSAWGTGSNVRIDARRYHWGHELGEGEGWEAVETIASIGRSLIPASLPPMIAKPCAGFRVCHVSDVAPPTSQIPFRASDNLENEVKAWQRLMDGDIVQVPPHTTRRVLVDMQQYYCGRVHFDITLGCDALIRVHWAEALYEYIGEDLALWSKGNRGEIEGKYFTTFGQCKDGVGDEFITDEFPHIYVPLWWQAGRYLEIVVVTQEEGLLIESFPVVETRYPLESQAHFECSDARLKALEPIMLRALQTCAHETYMDCPFYEQMMYVGDTRLEVLLTYALTTDDRLPRKALQLFDWSREPNGLTQSRYPCWDKQIIPPFSLWWVAMCHDYALWRGDAEFVKSLLPGVRAVCDYFASIIAEDGLMGVPEGWNFTDWVKTTKEQLKYKGGDPIWKRGVPPKGEVEPSGVLNWHAVLAFQMASELEGWFGEAAIAATQQERADRIAAAIEKYFWNEEKGVYADDLAHEYWSEHAQCLAILSGRLDEDRLKRVEEGLFSNPDLARTTIYFSHYLLEVCRVRGRMDQFFKKLELWHGLIADDLKTTIEMPEPTRSDCHAWGAHPLFHVYATLAGIRPTAPGFTEVEIKPQLGELSFLEVAMPHPRGEIRVSVEAGKTEISVPEGVKRIE